MPDISALNKKELEEELPWNSKIKNVSVRIDCDFENPNEQKEKIISLIMILQEWRQSAGFNVTNMETKFDQP